MMILLTTLLSFVALVNAHGYVTDILFGSTVASTWLPFIDPYLSPVPQKITRKFNSDGPVTDLTSKAITCNTNGATMNVPVSTVQKNVKAGQPVTFYWTNWPQDHYGPVMTYMADCKGDCTKFDGSTGNVWFKINQAGYSNGVWATDKLRANNNSWTVTIPNSLAAGQYLIRHEILALHGAYQLNGAQFYPSCNQISLTSSGSLKPAGVALPGAYKSTDPGIFVDIWADGFHSYVIPGPPVISTSSGSNGAGGGGGGGGSGGGSSSTSTGSHHKPTTTDCAPTKTVTRFVTKTVYAHHKKNLKPVSHGHALAHGHKHHSHQHHLHAAAVSSTSTSSGSSNKNQHHSDHDDNDDGDDDDDEDDDC